MNEITAVILSMSLSGGIVIVMLYLVLLLSRKKLCRQWQYYICLIAIIRLLLPFAPQKNLMDDWFRSAKPSISELDEPSPETALPISDKIPGKTSDKGSTEDPPVLSNAIGQSLWIVWLLPAVLLLARKIITYEKDLRSIRAGSKEVQDNVLLEEFSRLLERYHVRNKMTLSVNSRIRSPVMIGLSDPHIILPTVQMTLLEFRHTISHELVHYRRGDILYKWLTQLAVCVHWSNPLLYIMERSINRACELSCDEAVIWDFDEQERYAYGDTLLQAAGRNVKCEPPTSPIAFSDSKKRLKERLDAIMDFKKITKTAYIAMFFLTILLLFCSYHLGVYAATKQKAAAGASGTKTAASPSTPAQAPHSVLYKNGGYFILFDNAKEKDLPHFNRTRLRSDFRRRMAGRLCQF